MMKISLFKKLFKKGPSEEALKVWDELKKSNNPLDDPACKIYYDYAGKLNHNERVKYLEKVWHARHKARVILYTEDKDV